MSSVHSAATGDAGALPPDMAWVVEPIGAGPGAAVKELWRYRRLLAFFSVQAIKGLYEGTSLGIFWLFARPLLPIFISSFVFGSLLKIPSDGLPYFLFFLTGMSVWMFFDRSLLWVTRSLDQQKNMIKKLYFPRLLVPVSAMAPAAVYFGIYMTIIVGASVYYLATTGTWYLSLGPGWLVAFGAALLATMMAMAVGLFTCVWQLRFKEIRFGLRYFTGFWFYLTPVIYPMSQVPENRQWIIYLNPMASVVETFKCGLLGVGELPIRPLLSSTGMIIVLTAVGVWYFNRSEATSVDQM